MEKVHILPNYHSDAVSSINIFYNKNRENWQAWTSSWDKSVCVWIIGNVFALCGINGVGQKLIPEGYAGASEEKKKKPQAAVTGNGKLDNLVMFLQKPSQRTLKRRWKNSTKKLANYAKRILNSCKKQR
jgi:hypothetical protein